MKRKLLVLMTGLLLLTLGACDSNNQNAQTNDELVAELERLENELGRLEFRVYALEHPDVEDTADDAPPAKGDP
jgi:hypothetical protein